MRVVGLEAVDSKKHPWERLGTYHPIPYDSTSLGHKGGRSYLTQPSWLQVLYAQNACVGPYLLIRLRNNLWNHVETAWGAWDVRYSKKDGKPTLLFTPQTIRQDSAYGEIILP